MIRPPMVVLVSSRIVSALPNGSVFGFLLDRVA